ncbi:hypothetical protein Gotur_030016 [Gossypium turneri]
MSRIFWNIEFQFIPREANGLAYAMAAWGRGRNGLTKYEGTQKMMDRGNEVKTKTKDLL